MDVTSVDLKQDNVTMVCGSIRNTVCGIVMGWIVEYYTSDEYKPTQELAHSSLEGTALTITGRYGSRYEIYFSLLRYLESQ